MSILIRGMGLPTYGATNVLILQNGEVYGMKYWSDKWELLGQAIELPPHGRLIDADALMKGEGRYIISFGKEGIDVAEINRAPTIIPASGGKEDE